METVVAMEELGKVDTDNNGIIDLNNIIEFVGPNNETKQLTAEYQEWIELLDSKAEEDKAIKESMIAVKVGNSNLWDIAH
jgi:hypothetical protein